MGDPARIPGDAEWYTDGPYMDGPLLGLGVTGFGVVATGLHGEVLAMANGRPPAFIRNAAGAEAWALHVVLSHTAEPPTITTDCLGLINQAARGLVDATMGHRSLARVWGLITADMDGVAPPLWIHNRFRWMPAHKSRAAVGTAIRSDGVPVSYQDWRTNRLADKLAKLSADRGRAPLALRTLLADASQAVEHSAALLGLTTYASNNFAETAWRDDGSACTLTRRDAFPPAFLATGRGARPGATGPRTSTAPATHPPPRHDPDDDLLAARLQHQRSAKHRARQAQADKDDAAEARGLRAWHLDRAAAPPTAAPSGPTAGERLAALRARVLARAQPP